MGAEDVLGLGVWAGSVQPWVGSGEPNRFKREYIRAVSPFSFISTQHFSLLLLYSLGSLSRTFICSSYFHPETDEGKGGSGGSWPASAAAPPRRNPNSFIFCNFLF